MKLEALVNKLGDDVRDEVDRARGRWNQSIREALRHETGLLLNRPEPARLSPQRNLKDTVWVPIKVDVALPTTLEKFELDADTTLAAVLSRWRSTLEMLKKSTADAQTAIRDLRGAGQTQLLGGREAHLPPAQELAESLLKELDRVDPVTKILAVNEHVLGRYSYTKSSQPSMLGPDLPTNITIELYWGVIGLVARWLGKSVKAVTVVVLAHELAHADTHLGAEIGGDRWPTGGFARSEAAPKEGLAQYYTELVCRRLVAQIPEALEAYTALLERQPDAYRTHEQWIKESHPEEVRFAMIATRRRGVGEVEAFKEELEEAQQRLRNCGPDEC